MKIGILQCCAVLPQFQEQFGDYPDMFIKLFHKIDPSITFDIFDIREHQFPMSLDQCDAYITTGSRTSTYEDLSWIPPFKQLIKDLYFAKKKLVGICFGHQLIADTLGGYTELSDKGWGVGVSKNNILVNKSWMNPELKQLNIIVSHQDQVTELPRGAELLASSDFCPNYMYQISNEILTIQGHPEFTKSYAETLMKYREEKLGSETLKLGLKSLEHDVHSDVMAQWMLNFVQDGRQ